MMLNQQQIEALRPKFNVLKIIAGALPAGFMTMMLVLVLVKQPLQFSTELSVFAILGLAFGTVAFLASFIVPSIQQKIGMKLIAREAASKTTSDIFSDVMLNKYFGLIQSALITRFALLEGAMFFNLMIWYLESSLYNLAFAAAGLALMAIYFPFESSSVSKIESVTSDVENDLKMQS